MVQSSDTITVMSTRGDATWQELVPNVETFCEVNSIHMARDARTGAYRYLARGSAQRSADARKALPGPPRVYDGHCLVRAER